MIQLGHCFMSNQNSLSRPLVFKVGNIGPLGGGGGGGGVKKVWEVGLYHWAVGGCWRVLGAGGKYGEKCDLYYEENKMRITEANWVNFLTGRSFPQNLAIEKDLTCPFHYLTQEFFPFCFDLCKHCSKTYWWDVCKQRSGVKLLSWTNLLCQETKFCCLHMCVSPRMRKWFKNYYSLNY